MEYDIVIMTTATSRPDLHKECLPAILDFTHGYSCKWIISIDQLKDTSIEDTVSNLKNILKADNIDLEINPSGRLTSLESFFKSVKWCINEGFKYKPKYGYFWLEDDWLLHGNKSLKNILNKGIKSNEYIGLVNRKKDELNFNPCIWSPELFEKYMVTKINQATKIKNPERTCVYSDKGPESLKNIEYTRYPLFKDMGRNWTHKNLTVHRTYLEKHEQ